MKANIEMQRKHNTLVFLFLFLPIMLFLFLSILYPEFIFLAPLGLAASPTAVLLKPNLVHGKTRKRRK